MSGQEKKQFDNTTSDFIKTRRGSVRQGLMLRNEYILLLRDYIAPLPRVPLVQRLLRNPTKLLSRERTQQVPRQVE